MLSLRMPLLSAKPLSARPRVRRNRDLRALRSNLHSHVRSYPQRQLAELMIWHSISGNETTTQTLAFALWELALSCVKIV